MAGQIVFDRDMDIGALPALGTFTLTSDGVPLPMIPIAWDDPRSLACNTAGTPPVVDAYVKQNRLDTNCYSAAGTYARKQADVQWFP